MNTTTRRRTSPGSARHRTPDSIVVRALHLAAAIAIALLVVASHGGKSPPSGRDGFGSNAAARRGPR